MNTETNEIVKVISESGVEQSTADTLQKSFMPFFDKAREWKEKAGQLVVTDISQTREMKMAREARLALKEIRVDADKTRKALKEDSLRYGKAVQGVYNVIEYLIAPIEKHLEDQEKFAERMEEKRIAAMQDERLALLHPYMEFVPFASNYGAVTEEAWEKLFNGAKMQFDAKVAAEKKAEEDRIAREKAEAEERERIRKENERLRKEAEEAERMRKEIEDKAQREREESARKLAAEQAESRRIAAKLKAKQDAEEDERKRKEKEESDRIAAERKAAKAPDKVKLTKWVESFSIPEISLKEQESNNVANSITAKFNAFKTWAMSQIETL